MFKFMVPVALAATLAAGAAFADGGGTPAPEHVPGAKQQPVSALNMNPAQLRMLAEEAGVTPDQAKSMTLSDLARLKEKHNSMMHCRRIALAGCPPRVIPCRSAP